jgi:hypothetical protein
LYAPDAVQTTIGLKATAPGAPPTGRLERLGPAGDRRLHADTKPIVGERPII